MSKQKYEQYVVKGPDGMGSHADVEAALSWRDNNRIEAARIQRAYDDKKREEARKHDLVQTALDKGASQREAGLLAESIMSEEREKSIREADETARGVTYRNVVRGF